MKPKVGDKITAVYRNKVNRYVLLLRVTKAGRKYIHGITLYVNPDGDIREGHETKIDMETSTIYSGLRKDLKELEYKYRSDYKNWQNAKKEKKEDLEYELKNYVWGGLKEWEEKNPMPQPPEFPKPSIL